MDSQTSPHLQSQNPSSINPTTKNQKTQKKKPEKSMYKFKEVVMKIAENSDPNNKSLIEQRLTQFLSDFHTPDHPPYAAMIHRAIQELNEKGGSSEESISQYIKKQYTDLPWAHYTLLKHHLGKLCDCGEILVTRKQFYLLAGANLNLNSRTRPKKEQLKRKRKGESRRGRGRRWRKKDETEEGDQHEEEHWEVIGARNICNEEQDELTGKHNEIKEYKVDVVGEQNQVLELPNEVIEEQIKSVDQQNGVIGNEVYEQRNEVTGDGEHELKDGSIEGQSQPQRQETVISVEQIQSQRQETGISVEQIQPQQKKEGNAICLSIVDSNVQIKHPEKQNQPELSSHERPPGFELAKFKELSQHVEEHWEVIGERNICNEELDELTGTQNEIKEFKVDLVGEQNQVLELPNEVIKEQIESDEQQHEVIGSEAYEQWNEVNGDGEYELKDGWIEGQSQPQRQETGISEEQSQSQQKQEGYAICVPLVDSNVQIEHLEKQNQPELSSPVRPPGFELVTFKGLSQSQEQHTKDFLDQQQYEVLPNSERLSEVELPTVKGLSDTLQQIKEEQRWRRQVKREGRSPFECKSAPSAIVMELLPVQHQQQQPELSNTESLQEVKSTEVELLNTHQQQAKHRGRRKLAKSHTKERKTQDVTIDSEQIELKQHSDLSDPEKSSEVKLTAVESFPTEKQQQLEICGEQEAPEPQTGVILASFDLPADSKQLDQEEQPDESIPGSPIEIQQVTTKQSSQTERQLRQLRRWSQRVSEPKQASTSSVDLLPCSQLQDHHLWQPELQDCELPQVLKQKPFEESTYFTKQQAKLRSWQKRKISHLNTVTDSPDSLMGLDQVELKERPGLTYLERCQQPEALEELSRQQQAAQGKLPRRQLRPRPPKFDSERDASTIELSASGHQHDGEPQPERRGRGRPPKPKPDTIEVQSMQSDHQNQCEQEHPAQRGCGRPPKVIAKTAEVLSNTNSPNNSQQEQQPTYRGRGRPPKPKQATTSTTKNLIPSDKQNQRQ